MNRPFLFVPFVAVLCLGLGLSTAPAQHGHLNAGAGPQQPLPALNPTQGDQLFFANGDDYASGSGYALPLTYATTGPYAGLHQGSLTTTALPATTGHGGPAAYHPALGSFLQLKLLSVSGPAGGVWSFWEAGATSPTFSLASGQATTTAMWALSESDGSPGSDPHGHRHGRRYTTDLPGLYTVAFQLVDTSANGTGGGAIHTASEIFRMDFDAVPEPTGFGLLTFAGIVFMAQARRAGSPPRRTRR